MGDEPVDVDAVAHVARLARIDLDEAEQASFAEQFAEILSWFAALDDVPDVEPSADVTNVLRPDEVAPSLDVDAALANAPRREDDHFRGPPVG